MPETEYELVNHPSHYGGEDNPYEAIKIIAALGLLKGFCLGSAIKYIIRAGTKPGAGNEIETDLRKAAWYINYYADTQKNHDGEGEK